MHFCISDNSIHTKTALELIMESKKGENADMKESKGNISKKKINIKDIISNNK